jgi:hypothetical protein
MTLIMTSNPIKLSPSREAAGRSATEEFCTVRACIQKVLASNLAQNTKHPDLRRNFPHAFHENAGGNT